jgi:serine phosphatase RsbU (regulator of sigma subunit)
MRLCLVVLILLVSFSTFGQNTPYIDSLRSELSHIKNDTVKIKILNNLSWEYRNTIPDTAIIYANEALQLAEEENHEQGKGAAHNNLGVAYWIKGDYTTALEHHFKALKSRELINEWSAMTMSYNNIANIYENQANDSLARVYYQSAIDIAEEHNFSEGMALSYSNMAIIHHKAKEYDKAIEFYTMAIVHYKTTTDYEGIARVSNNMGYLFASKKDFVRASKYLNDGFEANSKMGNKRGMIYTLMGLGNVSRDMLKTTESVAYYKKAVAIAEEMGAIREVSTLYKSIAMGHATEGLYREAFENYQIAVEYNDTLLNEEKDKITKELQSKYENEKKEAEIALLKKDEEANEAQIALLEKKEEVADAESKQKTAQQIALLIGLLLVLILAGAIYLGYRNKSKTNELLSAQNVEIEEKNQEITDSINYARKIQEALLTSEDYRKKMFPDHFILFAPKDIVSGDFYWAYQTPDKKAIWVAADCTGHGVPGAFMSMIGNSLLNEIVVEGKVHEPHQILEELRSGIIKALRQKGGEGMQRDGMDMAICAWDKKSNVLSFSGANNPLWIIRQENETPVLQELKASKQPVGYHIGQPEPFIKHDINLQKGDLLYTFTDGYSDQFGGPKGKKFKQKQLKDLLLNIAAKPMHEQQAELEETVLKWRGDLEQIDDICIIGVNV